MEIRIVLLLGFKETKKKKSSKNKISTRLKHFDFRNFVKYCPYFLALQSAFTTKKNRWIKQKHLQSIINLPKKRESRPTIVGYN